MSAAVVRLPTAAPRKVRQPWNKATRAAAIALRREAPFRYRRPERDEPEPVAVEQTPVLAFAFAIYSTLTDQQKDDARFALFQMKERGSREAQAILDVFTVAHMGRND